jgi:hypothetical protein
MECERCHMPMVGSCGKNVNTDKVYCEICLDSMSKTTTELATFLACKREPVYRVEKQRKTA